MKVTRFKPGPHERIHPKVVVKRNSPNQSSRFAGIGIIVLHSTESHNVKGNADLDGVASWFANPAAQASAHVVTDADGRSARCVKDGRKAWHVGNLNSISLGIEQIGFAAQGRNTWKRTDQELRETARWIATWSLKHDIPIRKAWLTRGGSIIRKGVTTHAYCSSHGAGTDHTDPGDYPMGLVLWYAKGYRKAQKYA